MKTYILKKYQKFIHIFFIIFISYILFSSSFLIINNYNFLNVVLNLLYLFWTSFIFLFFMGILVKILVNFRQMKKTTISTWKLILFSNWQIIILWLCNIALISYLLFFSHISIVYELQSIVAYKEIYSFLVILCYVFYAIFTLSFIIMLILFRLYLGYLKKINDVIIFSYYIFLKSILPSFTFQEENHLTISILAIICFNFNFNQGFIKTTIIIDNLRKTELLIQFRKQTTPPRFIFN